MTQKKIRQTNRQTAWDENGEKQRPEGNRHGATICVDLGECQTVGTSQSQSVLSTHLQQPLFGTLKTAEHCGLHPRGRSGRAALARTRHVQGIVA